MRVYISSDIEGTAGIARWNDAEQGKSDQWYDYFREQMSKEVAAACEGAIVAGAEEIFVKDAHDTACNINPGMLPREARLNRGWSGHPYCMVEGLAGYDALVLTGYHAPAGNGGNPLSHTMDTRIEELMINGQVASEFTIAAYTAGHLNVPVAFVSGDAAVCGLARQLVPGITAVAVNEGRGGAVTGLHPDVAVENIREGVEKALTRELDTCRVAMPSNFEARIRYQSHSVAYKNSFYPGAEQPDDKTVAFKTTDYFELLRFFHFTL